MKITTSVFISFALFLVFCTQSFSAVVVPTVVTASTVPAAATGVSLTTNVSVTFSTGMTASTITTSSFYIRDAAGNQVATNAPVSSNSNKTFTITPTVNLAACGTYTIIVTTSVKSSSYPKGSLATQYIKTFQTITDTTAPTVTGRVPAVGATGVNESSPVTVTFSKLMDTSTIDATVFGLDNGATGNITFSTAGNVTTAIYTPSPNLVGSTLYTATVGTGAKSACNVAMSSPYSWTFTTRDAAAPYVTSTAPSNGAVNIAQTSPISINFNEAMQALTGTNISVTDGTNTVAGTVTFDTTSKLTATFTPTNALSYNTVYYVTVTGARDLAGNIMAPNPYSFSFTSVAQEIMQYCNIPLFVSTNLMQPNVLLIMDNSNSMDEDFNGAAVGSWSPFSKSVAGKTALRSVVQTYSDSMRIGLMTYNLPSLSSENFISNSPYFVSYQPKSYCPVPPSECADYCETGNATSQSTCRSECQLQNPLFDETYMDEVITVQGAGARRTKYCGLVYPKTQRMINPADPTRYIYYKQALPYYTTGNPGNQFDYAQTYTATQEIVNTTTSTNSYAVRSSKTGTSDDFTGYSGGTGGHPFTLSDSDLALGYGNIGRRVTSVAIGGTKFANSSPGGGFLQIAVATNDTVNTQKNLLLTKLTTYSGNEAGYMSCTDTANPNACSYIINAGLTPTAGTLQTATNYFAGASSPIQERCQKNFIVYVTDGLPSVNESGTVGSADTLIGDDTNPASGTVLKKLDALHAVSKTLGGTPYTFNLKTYVLGLGLTSDAKEKLELMATHGGTGQAYYADNATQLNDALDKIFRDINAQISSGTSASIVNNRGESGANLFHAVFYPKKSFGDTDLQWIGDMQNLWYYLDPLLGVSSIREDTDFNKYLDLKADDKVTVDYDVASSQTVARWFKDTTGNGNFTADTVANARTPLGSPDNIRSLWRAGALLHYRSAASRTIYSVLGSYNSHYLNSATETVPSTSQSGLTLFTTSGYDATTTISPFNSYLNVANAATGLKIIDYIRGIDDPAYRSRAVSITYPNTNPAPLNTTVPINASVAAGVGIWKLGDIVSSTPQAQTSKQLQSYDTVYGDSSYAKFYKSADYSARNMVYTAANDGMLHAFRVGQVLRTAYSTTNPYRIAEIRNLDSSLNLGDEEWAFIPKNSLPYLKYLAAPEYNHLFYVDNTVRLRDASINKPVRTKVGYECTQAEYWKCEKKTATTTVKACTTNPEKTCTTDADCPEDPDPAVSECVPFTAKDDTSWRTVLIGGMGIGGASRDYAGYCNKTDGTTPTSSAEETRFDCVKSPIAGAGLSSFFALDVTEPQAPKFMWEFSDAVLPAADKGIGFATSGPVFVRIAARNPATASYGTPDHTRNGRTFAVFATGSSGPIDTTIHQFLGRSDNTLKVYVVDVHPDMTSGWVKNTNYWVFDSGITNGFAGDLANTSADLDWSTSSTGYYSDDVVYIGYTKPAEGSDPLAWTAGGVLRLLTNDSLNPAHWKLSKLIDNIGPVTSSPTRIQDRKNGKLWVFWGTGRYFYKNNTGVDDPDSLRRLYGVYDTCYDGTNNKMNAGFNSSGVKIGCGLTDPAVLSESNLQDQSTTIAATLTAAQRGWYITLDSTGDYATGTLMTVSAFNAERVVTNTSAAFNGVVTFTTFKPSDDVCAYGGKTHLWFVDYPTGGVPPAATMNFKTLVQLSSGQFVSIDGKTATKAGGDAAQQTRGDRRTRADIEMHGSSGGEGGSRQGLTVPVRKILHIMEK